MGVPVIKTSYYKEAEDSYLGWCIVCQDFTTSGVEPDADNCTCDECGEMTVKGTLNAILDGEFLIID